MEAVGAVSSILALIDMAKTLVEMGKEVKNSLGMVSGNQVKLRDLGTDLVESLEHIHELIQDRQQNLNAERLRDALALLQADLQAALDRCRKLCSSRPGLRGAFAAWRERDDIADEIERLEKKVNKCYQRFSTGTTARTELTVLQLRAEIHTRLDQVEAGLQNRFDEAGTDPSRAQELVGARDMSRTEMKRVIKRASKELEKHSISSLEKQYLQTIVKTLTHVVSQTPIAITLTQMQQQSSRIQEVSPISPPAAKSFLRSIRKAFRILLRRPKRGQRPAETDTNIVESPPEPWFLAHYGQSTEPTQERQDIVMRVIQTMKILRSQDQSVPMETTAKELHALSAALSDLGMYQDAWLISQEDIKIYRNCVGRQLNGYTFEVVLSGSLRVAAIAAYRLGRFSDAVALAQEALDIVRRLSKTEKRYRSLLASLLNTFSHYLGFIGRFEEAADLAREALGIRRVLVSENSELYLPDLAESLLNASLCLGQAEFFQEGLEAAQEAISVYRSLASKNPDLYEAALATSLHGTAKRLMDLGRWQEVYELVKEDIEVHTRLAKKRPDVFLQKVGWGQMLMGYCLVNLGRFDEALDYSKEGVKTLELLVSERPLWTTPWLVVAHGLVSLSLFHLGPERHNESLESAQTMLQIHQTFVKNNPRFVNRDLALAFRLVSENLAKLGCPEEALELAKEVMFIQRALSNGTAKGSGGYKVQLVEGLIRSSGLCRELGRTKEGREHAEEAVLVADQLGNEEKYRKVLTAAAEEKSNYEGILEDGGGQEIVPVEVNAGSGSGAIEVQTEGVAESSGDARTN